VLIRRGLRGVGEYPGYYCYDANRPSWLPYWLDSIAESLCKYTPSTIAGNIAHCATNQPDCGNPSAAQQNPELSGPGVAPAGEPTNTPVCSGFQTFNPATAACEFNLANPLFLAVVLASILAFGFAFGAGRRT
jgi:hypothetical protein